MKNTNAAVHMSVSLALLVPGVALAQAKALTDEIVAAATAKQCGFSFDRKRAIEATYGKDVRKSYERDSDVAGGKYKDVLAGAKAWVNSRLSQLDPTGQVYYFFMPVSIYPSSSTSPNLKFSVSYALTGFPATFCRSGRGRKFVSSLANIDVCRTGFQPWQDLHGAPLLSWGDDLIEFSPPKNIDIATVLGGEPDDRAAVVRVEGTFSGCTNVSSPSLGSARFVPSRVSVFGASRGHKWFVNTYRDWTGSSHDSVVYARYAREPIISLEFPAKK